MSEKISVLIPTFNREKYIKTSLQSILEQTYINLDVLIYDDGSTDNTISIIKEIMKTDDRIKLIENTKNNGVGYARNILLKNCNTKYACWHDSDDISNINRIREQLKYLSKDTLVFAFWSWLKFTKGVWHPTKIQKTTRAFATIMFPVNKNITFKEDMRIGGEDWDWIKRMKEIYKEGRCVDKLLYYVRFHDDRIGVWKRKIKANIPIEIQKKLGYKELIKYYKEHYE